MSDIPQYFDALLLILSLCLALYSGATHNVRLFLASVACFLNGRIIFSFMSLTKNIFSFGLVWPMLGLAGILTLLFFKIPRRIGTSRYLHNNIIQIAIVVSIAYCLVSLPLFLFPIKSFRVILSFILPIYVGWKLLGGLLSKNSATIYKNILTILYVGAFIAALDIVINVVLFNAIHPGFWHSIKSVLFFIEHPATRFQSLTNAVSMGYALVFLIIIALNWTVSAKSLFQRFLLLGIAAYSCYLLLNTGSRGPLLTLCIIIFIFLVHSVLSKAYPLYIKFISGIVLALIFILLVVTWDLYIWPYISVRGFTSIASDSSLIEIFKSSRIYYLEDIINVANQMGYNKFVGAGPGADAKIVEAFDRHYPVVESFFIAMFFNWGVIGGVFYILGMAALSYQVIKMERIERALGNKHAWLATVWILIPWISSPFAYGFGIPGGGLCLTFAIGAGALCYCKFHATVSNRHG